MNDEKRNATGSRTPSDSWDAFWDPDELASALPEKPRVTVTRETPEATLIEAGPRTGGNADGPDIVRDSALSFSTRAKAVSGDAAAAKNAEGPVPDTGNTAKDNAERAGSPASVTRKNPDLHPYETGDRTPVSSELGKTHNIPPYTGEEPEPQESYVPDSLLLHRVLIFPWESQFNYFDSFPQDAVRVARLKPAGPARPCPFFSYFPQYSQLTRGQLAWYVYWREEVRQGRYLETDNAYVLLLVFELINLPPEEISPREAVDMLVRVWMAYRRVYPRLDNYMCEWLCDYCLIHGIMPDYERLRPAMPDILGIARLKEFYLSLGIGHGNDRARTVRMLLAYCCQYDYKKSKFYAEGNRGLFDETIPRALENILPAVFKAGQQANMGPDARMFRDSYVGALCSFRNKRRIEVRYSSFSRSHQLRFFMGDAVKYCENRLRAYLGVRSRLSVILLTPENTACLDMGMNDVMPHDSRKVSVAKSTADPIDAYNELYDAPLTAGKVSPEAADRIEKASWETTQLLVNAFSDTYGEDGQKPGPVGNESATDESAGGGTDAKTADAPAVPEPRVTGGRDGIPDNLTATSAAAPSALERDDGAPDGLPFGRYTELVDLVLNGGAAGKWMADRKLLPGYAVDEVNRMALDNELIGDVILELDDGGNVTLIPDYRDIVGSMLT